MQRSLVVTHIHHFVVVVCIVLFVIFKMMAVCNFMNASMSEIHPRTFILKLYVCEVV